MAPLSTATRVLARSVPRCCRPAAAATPATTTPRALSAAFSTSVARTDDHASTYSFKSPFRGAQKADAVPDFGDYVSKKSGSANQLFGYFMVGTLGAISAAGAKSTVQGKSVRSCPACPR